MNIRNFNEVKSIFFDNKTLKQTVFKNTFWLAIAEVVQKGVGFLVVIWLARHFGPAIYGQWAFALSFVALFAIFADFGFGTLTVREIARDKSKTSQYIDNIVAMKLILGLITLGLVALVIQFLGKETQVVKLVYFLGIYAVVSTFSSFFQSIFRANEKMQYETICRAIQSLSLLGLVAFFILNKGSILTISYAYIGAALIGAIISLGAIWRYFSKFFLKIDFKICREILKEAWPFALSAIAILIYYRIDTVMLGVFKENEAVGYYNAAYNIILLIITGVSLLVIATFPTLSNFYKYSIEKFKKNINLFFQLIFLTSFPLIILIFFLAKPIINVVYGKEFVEFSPVILQILIWSVLILYNYAIFAIGLSASDKQRTYLKGVILGATFNTLTNLVVIPKYSYYGAATTTVLTEIVVCSYMSYRFLNFNRIKLPTSFIKKIILSSLIMFLIIYYCIYFANLNLIFALISGLITFIFMIFILKIFKEIYYPFYSMNKQQTNSKVILNKKKYLIKSKEEDYFNSTRWDLIRLIRNGNNKILEIGCGTGNTGRALKESGKAAEVIGVEIVPEIAKIAETKLDKVICGDIEVLDLHFDRGYFDYVIMGDVLEHLYDPWGVVSKIRCYIKEAGYVIASIPNVRNWWIIKNLVLRGKWEYADAGLLDDTHLRFFTKKSIIRLFQSSGFRIVSIVPAFRLYPTSKSNIMNTLTLGLLESFLARQYIIKAKNELSKSFNNNS